MHIVLIADSFPPDHNSAAVQLRDLAREFVSQGIQVTVLLPCSPKKSYFSITDVEGYTVVRLKAPKTKDVSNIKRAINEILMPFAMLRSLRKIPNLNIENWDNIIWYSPSIFHGPLIHFLKSRLKVKTYLIIRDIFPDWAVDLGIIRWGLPYLFFKLVANYQYSLANIIGVQTSGNLVYFSKWSDSKSRKLRF